MNLPFKMSYKNNKSDEYSRIPVAKDNTQWVQQHWCEGSNFDHANDVLIAFRTVGSSTHEFWANRYAAAFTAKSGGEFPSGRMCHAEILLPLSEDKWCKCSVIKKAFAGRDKQDQILWKPMGVHCVLTSSKEWRQKYIFLRLNSARAHIKKMLLFCLMNNGMPFNFAGYYANMIVPGGIGVRRYHPSLCTQRRAYFCTELIATALMVLASAEQNKKGFIDDHAEGHWTHTIFCINPATSSPNSLYDLLTQPRSQAHCTTPIGKELSLV